jgi:signal transduction histidine kinase
VTSAVPRLDARPEPTRPDLSVRMLRVLLLYFERTYGRARLEQVWKSAGLELPLQHVETLTNFVSLDFVERLYEALAESSGDADFLAKAGMAFSSSESLGFVYHILRAFAVPRVAYARVVEGSHTYNRVGSFNLEHLGDTRMVLTYRSRVRERNRNLCRSRMANFASLTTIWGLPPAEVEEKQCQVLGAPCCEYHLRWLAPPPTAWRYLAWGAAGTGLGFTCSLLDLAPAGFAVLSLGLAGLGLGAWLDTRHSLRKKDEQLSEQNEGLIRSLEDLQRRNDEVFRVNRELEDRVAARTRDLRETNARLEQALLKQKELDRLKSEFFDNVSHELRTPLTLILLTLDSLLHGPRALAPSLRQPIESMSRSASRLLQLINNLLDLARMESGKTRLRYEPLELQSFLRTLLEPFQVMATRKGVALRLEGSPVSAVHVDLERMESVFQNLVSNAMKFTAQGEVVVRVWEEQSQVHVEVADTGSGIAAQDIAVIFDRFAQADSSGTRRFGGTGIGLALVKEVLELHAGSISVQSELGKGSTFHVRLPKGTAHIREELRATPLQQRSGRSSAAAVLEALPSITEEALAADRSPRTTSLGTEAPCILLVEDEPEIRVLLSNILAPYYRVLEAANGEEGRPDLVLSDVMMPVMSGLQMLQALRGQPDTVDLPVLLLTARQEVDAKVEGLSVGANDYLAKPFSPREMLARIEAQLRLRELAARAAENERLAATGLLTSGFAHEVRNPLNGLMNTLQPLRESLASSQVDTGTALAMLDVVEECGPRIRSLAQSLLSFFPVGSKPEAVDLGASLDMTLQALSGRFNEQVRVELSYQCQEPVYCDPGSLNQVWVNLLDNALRAVTAQGGGLIRLETVREGEEAVVRIADDGEGIRPEHMPRLFQPFFSTRPAGEGTGLGLALCQRIVLRHGGRIHIASEYGKGTRCEVRLPLNGNVGRELSPLLPPSRGPHHAEWKS